MQTANSSSGTHNGYLNTIARIISFCLGIINGYGSSNIIYIGLQNGADTGIRFPA